MVPRILPRRGELLGSPAEHVGHEINRGRHRAANLWFDRCVAPVEADTDTRWIRPTSAERRQRPDRHRVRVRLGEPGQDGEQQLGIVDGTGHRSCRRQEIIGAIVRHDPLGRFEADDSAVGRWDPNRSGSIGAEGERTGARSSGSLMPAPAPRAPRACEARRRPPPALDRTTRGSNPRLPGRARGGCRDPRGNAPPPGQRRRARPQRRPVRSAGRPRP